MSERIERGTPEPSSHAAQLPAMLNVEQVAALLNCSPRHVYRLNDAGRLPRPVRLGALVRWSRTEIERWIADGCPSSQWSAR